VIVDRRRALAARIVHIHLRMTHLEAQRYSNTTVPLPAAPILIKSSVEK
jgi:hypothetical protein